MSLIIHKLHIPLIKCCSLEAVEANLGNPAVSMFPFIMHKVWNYEQDRVYAGKHYGLCQNEYIIFWITTGQGLTAHHCVCRPSPVVLDAREIFKNK